VLEIKKIRAIESEYFHGKIKLD